jgi:2-dehydropantoate 2-reductase
MARIAIIGPGAIGGTLAGNLVLAGHHEVIMGGRRAADGIMIKTLTAEVTVPGPVQTLPASVGKVDWVWVATKTYSAEDTLRWIRGLADAETRVAVFQNGVEHRERFAGVLRADQIVPVVIDTPAERTAPNEVVQRGVIRLAIADDANGRELADLFADVATEITLTPDFKSAAWQKLAINAAGVICALVMEPSRIMQSDEIGQLALGLVAECVAVGIAEGAVFPDDTPMRVLRQQRGSNPDGINSLYGDRLAGRQTEIDARNGVIVRLGKKHGIPTPLNAMAVTLLEAQAAKAARLG